MNRFPASKKMTMSAVCIALCVVLPMAFHAIPNGGQMFLPMHIPVLLCGLICGWQFGFLCGILGPLLSSALTGMPPAPILPAMMVECGVYGITAGLMMSKIHSGSIYRDLYVSLPVAMLAGRMFSGISKALIFAPGMGIRVWVMASFVTALPGIVVQLVLLPSLVVFLQKANVIPARYPKKDGMEADK